MVAELQHWDSWATSPQSTHGSIDLPHEDAEPIVRLEIGGDWVRFHHLSRSLVHGAEAPWLSTRQLDALVAEWSRRRELPIAETRLAILEAEYTALKEANQRHKTNYNALFSATMSPTAGLIEVRGAEAARERYFASLKEMNHLVSEMDRARAELDEIRRRAMHVSGGPRPSGVAALKSGGPKRTGHPPRH